MRQRALALGLMVALGAGAAAAAELSDSTVIREIRARAETTLDDLEARWVERGGIEIVTGGPSAARTESRWGHVSLRFVGSAAFALDDLTIEAMAINSPDDSLARLMFKGAFGGYAIAPLVQTLGQLIRSYYFQETRGYSRTIVPSNPRSRRALLETLRDINRVHTGHDRYYFLTVNCTSYLAKILSRAGFRQLKRPVPFIPTQASLHLRRSFVSPWPELEGVSATRLLDYVAFDPRGLERARTLDLQRLVAFRGFGLGDNYGAAVALLAARTDRRSSEDVYGVGALPDAFYQSDVAGLDALSPEVVRATFTPEQIANARRFNQAALMTNYATSFCRGATAQCEYFRGAQTRMGDATTTGFGTTNRGL